MDRVEETDHHTSGEGTDHYSSSGTDHHTSGGGTDHYSSEGGTGKQTANQPTVWKSFKKAGSEFNQDARKMFHYVGRKLSSRRGQRQTKVKEIHILPGEDDDTQWARRMAGSGTSRSSSGSDPSN